MTERVELHEPFEREAQQREADMLGMHLFLASEIMLFGGLFAVAFVMRILHPEEVVEASRRLHLWIGAINTAVLLTSSLAVALAVQAARAGQRRYTAASLASAAGLGLLFLGIKGYEYHSEYTEGLLPAVSWPTDFSGPVERHFMSLYLVATSLHALHVSAGIVMLALLAWTTARRRFPRPLVVVETVGLYWHLVDVVWVFLYPVLYLVR